MISATNPYFVANGVEIIAVAFKNLRGVGRLKEGDLGIKHAKTFSF